MDITVRSHLIAGGAAALAAGVVVAMPSLPAPATLVPASDAAVEMAALANPIAAVLDSLGLASYWLGNPESLNPGTNYPADSPLYRAGWLFDAFMPHPNLAAPAGLSFPVTQQIVKNVFDYVTVAANLELDAAQTLITGILNAPGGVAQAGLLLLDGQVQAALDQLSNTLITPVVEAATAAVEGLLYPVTGIVNRGAAAIAATVDLVVGTVNSLIANTGLVINSVTNTIDELVFNLRAGDFEKVWNTAVGGFLGQFIPYTDGVACGGVATCRAGLPAQLIRSTVGGLASYPLGDFEPIWSVRWALAEGGQNIARALARPIAAPAAATAPAPAAAQPEVESPAAPVSGPTSEPVPVEVATESPAQALSKADVTVPADNSDEAAAPVTARAQTQAPDSGDAASAADTVKKPAKQRVSRKAD